MLGHMRERALRRTWKRRERGIVLDRAECGLPGERDFDARVQDASRIERILHSSETRERLANSADIRRKMRRRDGAILDELHRRERWIEAREDRARGVTERPECVFVARGETDRDLDHTRTSQRIREPARTRGDLGVG